ncbi:uncharacterized protein LOC136031842 isoform X2 [Artemia franciscana]|uniref:uncharacterized protein LOC136031842 isoform X2 n=1 Tax=Artemia franciscana TaxID=6661 RepID=UPI0032DAF86F
MYKKPTLSGIFPKPIDACNKDKFIKENIKRLRKLQSEKVNATKQSPRKEPLKALSSKNYKHVTSVIGNYIKNGDSPDGRNSVLSTRSQSVDRTNNKKIRSRIRGTESQKLDQQKSMGSTSSLVNIESTTVSKSPVDSLACTGNGEKGIDDWRAESGIHMYSDTTISSENSSHGSNEEIYRINDSVASDPCLSPSCPSDDYATQSIKSNDSFETAFEEKLAIARDEQLHTKNVTKEDAKPTIKQEDYCPPGCRLLEEKEKLHRLKEFEKSRDLVLNEINRLPVTSTTLRVRQLRQGLEKKLDVVESNIKEFQRKKVFVPAE